MKFIALTVIMVLNLSAQMPSIVNTKSGFFDYAQKEKEGYQRLLKGERQHYIGKELLSFKNNIQALSLNKSQVMVTLTPHAAEIFKKITTQKLKQQIAILVKGRVISTPSIQESIHSENFVIAANNEIEAKKTFLNLKKLMKK